MDVVTATVWWLDYKSNNTASAYYTKFERVQIKLMEGVLDTDTCVGRWFFIEYSGFLYH
jgi:hypothetical protein